MRCVNLILLPEASVFGIYPTVLISPPFDIACPRPEATIPIGQVQRSVFKGDLIGFNIDHLGGISITHWPKKDEPGFTNDGNGKMRPKFLEKTDKSELQGGKRRQYSKEKASTEKIPEELKRKMPSKVQEHSQNLHWSLKMPWISKSPEA
jgi:hypothetical protein